MQDSLGDDMTEIEQLRAKVAELEGANATHDAQVRRETLEEAAAHIEGGSVGSSFTEIAAIHAGWVRALIEGGA